MHPKFFPTPADFRNWLEKNHDKKTELFVGYYKKATGIPSIDWSQSVDQALCFGWIDGIRRKIDEQAYMIRFTPRKPKSHWSAVNLKKVKELTLQGLMKPEGIAAYERRDATKSEQASYERKEVLLDPNYLMQIKSNKKAWPYYEKLAPSYKKGSIHWVMSAKQEVTQLRRLDVLIASCEEGRKIPLLRRKGE